jgi:hypothetical protein
VAEEVVILNMANENYYGLNPVGGRVWELMKEPRSIREIRDALLEEYEVDQERCERDLLSLLLDMAEHELIEVHASG